MTDNTDFMASLMKIPYFAQLVQDRGEQWLADRMDALETSSFDFGKYAYFNDGSDPGPAGRADDIVNAADGSPATHDVAIDDIAAAGLSHPAAAGSDDIHEMPHGHDAMHGGEGHNALAHIAGADGSTDSFDFIGDFTVVEDKFDLSALGVDEFIFKGTDDFAGDSDPGVHYVKESGDTLVQIDTNGDGAADMQVKHDHAANMTASDSVL